MNLITGKDLEGFQDIFSKKELVNEGEVATKVISPSKLYCEVYEAFKLNGIPMAGEYESFESRGYKESGNSRHQAIQKFLMDHPDVEWIDPAKYVEENNLPFNVKPSFNVENLIKKHPDISVEEAKELLHEYEVLLYHKTQPLSFKLDGLIKYKGIIYILEIKTIGKKDLEKAPLEKHQPQGIAYTFLLKINHIAWVYESREDFKIKVCFQLIRGEEHQEIRNRLNRIIKLKDDVTKLERNLNKCTYCRYKAKCVEIFLGRKEEDLQLPF